MNLGQSLWERAYSNWGAIAVQVVSSRFPLVMTDLTNVYRYTAVVLAPNEMSFCLRIFFFMLITSIVNCLHCYQGWQIWSEVPQVNNVTLSECLPFHRCCSMVSSLPGTNFACYDNCPPSNYRKCGPDPKLGIQDVYFCYCKDHTDPDCRPYLGEDDRRK